MNAIHEIIYHSSQWPYYIHRLCCCYCVYDAVSSRKIQLDACVCVCCIFIDCIRLTLFLLGFPFYALVIFLEHCPFHSFHMIEIGQFASIECIVQAFEWSFFLTIDLNEFSQWVWNVFVGKIRKKIPISISFCAMFAFFGINTSKRVIKFWETVSSHHDTATARQNEKRKEKKTTTTTTVTTSTRDISIQIKNLLLRCEQMSFG